MILPSFEIDDRPSSPLSEEDTIKLNEWEEYLLIRPTKLFHDLMHCPESTIALLTGNRFGKNSTIAKHYIQRIWGTHPIEAKNLRPHHKNRVLRFCAETLPLGSDREDGDKNTIYPIFKKMLPRSWIRKDITRLDPFIILYDPQGGKDVVIEFVSYNQDVKAQVGVDRFSIWIDESCSKAFYEEQVGRTLTSGCGDIVISLTPCTAGITWQYEEIFEQSSVIIRTPAVQKRWNARFDKNVPLVQRFSDRKDIAVLMAASDDNPYMQDVVDRINLAEERLILESKHPTIKKFEDFKPKTVAQYLDGKMDTFDEDTKDIRRYGIFKQVSGKIFKDFDEDIHVIQGHQYFPSSGVNPQGIPAHYCHARGIDYHEHVDWHGGFIALSPENEAFIYNEFKMSPERYVTLDMAETINDKSSDYRYKLSLIDPLAAKTQVNTGLSTVDDLNHYFKEFKRENRSTGGIWRTWDTKSTRGREEVRKRLKNARMCQRPFNNRAVIDGQVAYLPTIWIFDNCRVTIEYLKNWRLDDWNDPAQLEKKEIKETPLQKYSHMNMVWEAVFKDSTFKPPPRESPREFKSLSTAYFKS